MANQPNIDGIGPRNETSGRASNEKEGNVNDEKKKNTSLAHEQADEDIARDPDFAPGSPNEDLDEGELARLGENNNPIE